MAEPTTTPASSQDSPTIGIGGATSGQAGATPSHETQAETGGSGGAQLTHSHGENQGNEDQDQGNPESGAGDSASPAGQAGARDSALQAGARGALDTRPEQGGGTGTGIGSRESGANQSQDDLPPR